MNNQRCQVLISILSAAMAAVAVVASADEGAAHCSASSRKARFRAS